MANFWGKIGVATCRWTRAFFGALLMCGAFLIPSTLFVGNAWALTPEESGSCSTAMMAYNECGQWLYGEGSCTDCCEHVDEFYGNSVAIDTCVQVCLAHSYDDFCGEEPVEECEEYEGCDAWENQNESTQMRTCERQYSTDTGDCEIEATEEWRCRAGYYGTPTDESGCTACSSVSFTNTCSVTNGTGTQTCYRTTSPDGSTSSSACTGSADCTSCCATSCSSGYHVSNCACVADTTTSTITFRSGSYSMTQTCTSGETITLKNVSNMTAPVSTSNGWAFQGWTPNLSSSQQTYTNAQTNVTCPSANTTLYGIWKRDITFKYYSSATATSITSDTRSQYYLNTATSTGTAGPVQPYTLYTQTTYGWTPDGWCRYKTIPSYCVDESPTATVVVPPANSAHTTYWAVYSRTPQIKYNANGGSGSMSNSDCEDDQKIVASGTAAAADCTLSNNGFTAPSNSEFSAWALGSTSGTQYEEGETFQYPNTSWTGSQTYNVYAIWETTTVHCNAGSYLNASGTCTTCENGYWCPGGDYTPSGSIQGRNSCPSVTSGFAYVSGTGWSAYSNCQESKTISACYTGYQTLTKTATSSSAWGTATGTLKAPKGYYVSGSGDSKTCSACTGATYQDTDGSTATSCTSCPSQTSGWTRATGTAWTSYTSCTETKTISACYTGYQTLTKTATSSSAWGTATGTLKAPKGYYVSGSGDSKTCSACADGTYQGTAGSTATSCTACTTTSGWATHTDPASAATAYTACYQTQTPTNCASGTVKRTASSISGTTITYGTATVDTALSSNAGYYVDGTSCTVCPNWTYYGGGTATECTACPSLTSGWTKATGTGWTSYSSCKETKTLSACYTGYKTLTKTATSSTTWGDATGTIKAPKGYYVSGSGDSKNCSACADGTYQGTAGSTATSCTACTTTSGWATHTDPASAATAYTACYQTQTPTNCASGTVKRTASSISGTTITYGTAAVDTALNSNAGYYVDGTSCTVCPNWTYYGGGTATECTACPTLTSGWTKKSGTGWTSYSSCKETKTLSTCSSSYRTLTKTASSASAWGTATGTLKAPVGYYVSGSGDSKTCSPCGAGTYQDTNNSTATSCSNVTAGYYNTGCGTDATGSVCSTSYSGGLIDAGYYCTAGAKKSNPASASDSVSSSAACGACSGLTGVNPTGGTYTSDGTRNAKTTCLYTAGSKTITGCKTVTPQQVRYTSSNTWPATPYVVTANKGYVIANDNSSSATCTACTGATYQDTDGSTATSCTACPTATSGWTRGTGSAWTSYSSCFEYKTPDNCASGSVKHYASSASAWGTTLSVHEALSSSPGYYVNSTACTICANWTYYGGGTATECTSCPTLTSGWTKASGTGWTSYSNCKETITRSTCSTNYQTLTKTATSSSAWGTATGTLKAPKGYYVSGTGDSKTCSTCTDGTYQATAGSEATSCTACTTTNGWATHTDPASAATAYTACYQTQTPANCASGTIKRTASSISGTTITYGTASVTSALSSNGGYYVNGTACTACGDAKYYAGGTATSCTSCTTTSGWATHTTTTTSTAYTACYQTQTPANCASGTIKRTASSISGTTITYGTAAVDTALSSNAGYYVNGTACTVCANGTFYGGGTATACTACPTVDSGYAYVSGTGWTAYSSCKEQMRPTNCYSGYLTKTASSATAWGTATNNLTAKGGYKVSGSGNSATCSACGNGYYSADGNDTTCDACPDATSTNWTVATTSTTATSYSACYETRNATNISSYCSAGVLKKTASSATAWGTASASTAFQAKAGSFVSGSEDSLSCTQCATGSYTASAGTQTSCSVCGSGTTTSAAGQTSCNATCSNNNAYDNAWATPAWNNNSPTGLCKITNCKSGSYYTSTNSGNTNTCTACADGSFMASNAHTTTACTLCSSLTGVSPSGGTYSTGGSTGSTANTACQYLAPDKTITGCKTVTSQSVTYSGSAWPASTYGVTASKGYVIANNNSSTATCSACGNGTYQATDGSTATSCTACSTTPGYPSGFTSGGTFSTSPTSAATASSACRYTPADISKPANCATVTTNTVSYSGSAWGTNFYTVTTTTGNYITANNTKSPTCAACSSLSGVSPSGGTYTTNPAANATANTACQYTAPSKTITGCKTVTSQAVTYSGTAWPASTYGVTASKGYVIANNNSSTATCTACTGATYQATDGATVTSCSACPDQTSGWTRGTGTAWTAVTSCYETRTPADCASGTIKHNATNSTTWGSDSVTTALTATANHYVSGTTCPTCSSGTNSNYTLSAAGTTSVNDCYLNTTATKYVAEAGAGEVTCLKGGYCPGGTSVYYGGTSTSSHPTTGGRTTCPANSFCVGGVSAATACSTLGGNLYTNSASGSDENSDCYITTTAGKYLAASTDTAQTQCPGANYCPSVTLYYPNVNTATPCPTADASTARTTYPDDFYNPTRNNISNQTWTKGITNIEGCMANYSFSNARGNFTTESTPYSSTSGKYDRTAGNKYYTKFNAGYYGVTKYSATYCNTGTNNMLYKDAQPCPAGSYCPGITTLPKCNTGTYADTLGIDACAAGSYSAGSASSCTVCPAGRTTSGEGTVFNTNANTTCSVTCSAIANLSTWTTPTWSKTYTAPLYSDTVTGTCTVDACVAGAYKSGNTCPVCATDKWSDAGATSCSNCSTTNGYHNSGDTAAAHAGSSSCIASCAAKTAVTTENAACATLGTGYWAAAHTVAYGSTSVVNTDYAQCPAGYRDGAVASAQSGCTMSVTGGKYVATQNASSATNCANWTWKGAHTVTYGNTSTCESCPTLDSGWAKKNSTGTGWTAVTQCVETHTPANCASGTTKKVATNSTTWGSEVFDTTLSSNAGYYAGTSAISCTICPAGSYCPAGATAAIACVTGSYTSTTGKSACTACQDGATTSGTGKTSCDATCANATDSEDENAIYSWSEATWNSNNTMSDLCKAATCYRDHYIDGNDCERCDSFANGFYPYSPSGTSSGQGACYLRKSDIPGMYIAEAYATVGTPCPAGKYSNGEAVIHYGETSTCSNCADNTYATAGSAACTPCAQNYTTPNGSAKDSESACRIYCAGGSYIATARDTTCTDVGAGYWAAGAYVAQGSTGTRTQCATGLTTVGRGTGADEAGDCGHKLHAGNSVVYLRSNKVTTPSLHMKIGGTTFYGNMSTQTIGSMRVKRDGQTYSVYDDITEEEGGVSGGSGGSGITINPSTEATTIVPATYQGANGETTWSAVVGETELEGEARCSATTAAHAELSTSSFVPEGSGSGCWCKLTSPATGTKWIFATTNASCSAKCGYYCANNMKGTGTKNINYRTNIYTSAGISTQ